MLTTIYYGKRSAIQQKFPNLDRRIPGLFLVVVQHGRRIINDAHSCNAPADVKSVLRTFATHFKGAEQVQVIQQPTKRVRIAL